ncbi:ribbon-helix-helix protein, CopG family [Streptomyces sp. 8N706]|uniref:ribbon-helix-helix protein, CopG family n=1 Tax=Streptomyces sp. 8N706 TaxID=3457416 RepID=UPI003FD45317
MATRMLSVRIDSETLESVKERAAARGMTVQEFVVTTLQRDEFEERFKEAFTETLETYGDVLAEVEADGDFPPQEGSAAA